MSGAKDFVLSGIGGVTNAVQFETDMVDVMLQGPGAGGAATAQLCWQILLT